MSGPKADAGVTGRKTAVDTYGGVAPHGGGAFSGKDPTKVDRTGAYAARYAALRIVEELGVEEAQVCLAYVFGEPEPVQVTSNVLGGSQILDTIDFRPAALIERFNLNKPTWSYQEMAELNHFIHNTPWNRTDA